MTSLSNFSVPTLPSMPRRSFIRAGALAVGGAVVATSGAQVAFGTPGNPATGDALVVIFLRGAADGLSLTPAIGSNFGSYADARPTLRIPENQSLALDSSNSNAVFPQGLDGVIGLHPAFQPLYDSVWASGNMAVVPGCGMPDSESTSRSHFIAQDQMQRGAAGSALNTGLLTRFESAQNAQGPIANVSTSSTSPELQAGSSQSYNVQNLVNFGLQRFRNGQNAQTALSQMYAGNGRVNEMGRRTLNAVGLIGGVEPSGFGGYPNSTLGGDLQDVAALLKSNVGVVSASVGVNGWDTHQEQGTNGGYFAEKVADVADSVNAFIQDLGPAAFAETNIAIITEFGRTLVENGNAGTDHGRGSSCFFIGGGVQGGVFGYDYFDEYTNPGGSSRNATPVFTDYRQPLEEILATRNNVGGLFPTKAPTTQLLGVARS